MTALGAIGRRLRAGETLADVQACATVEALGFCGFDRAIVLMVQDGRLVPQSDVPVADAASEALRRRALSGPLLVTAESDESELIRTAESIGRARRPEGSVLAGPLELRQWLTMPVMPEGRVLALLVLDRAGPSIGDRERDRAELFTLMLGHALESTVLRTRLAEVSAELRHLTASANALLQEAQHAPITLSTDHGWGAVFPSTEAAAGDELRRLLTDREQQIAALMVQGLSNPAIARELHLSPATVKAHVGRLLRKLGVSNRTEAAARVLALSG